MSMTAPDPDGSITPRRIRHSFEPGGLTTVYVPVTTTTASAEMCRLVICGPDRQIEIAVPAHVAVVDLLPALLHHLGDNLADAGLAHGGWVLQRLGGPALDEDDTVGSLGLADGSVVHLRPRADQIPPVHFDDLADGLAAGVANRSGKWRPEMTRWAAAGGVALVAGAGAVGIAATGPTVARASAAGIIAALALIATFVFARSFGDRLFASVAAVAGIGYAALAAMISPEITRDTAALVFGGPELFASAVVAATVALLAGALMGSAGPFIAALVSAAVCAATGVGADAFFGVGAAAAAATVMVVATVATAAVPVTAFRLARIYLAPLPTTPEHLQQDIDPEPADALLAQAANADRYMSGLHAGLSAAATIGSVVLALYPGWAPATLVVVAAVARLLALRPMTSGWQRLALAIPAAAGLSVLAVTALAGLDPLIRLPVVGGALVLATILLFVLATKLTGRRAMPVWGRIADILQLLCTVALLPLLAAVLHLYGAARALGG
jgi:type VII secretion integral membrane protein EccD